MNNQIAGLTFTEEFEKDLNFVMEQQVIKTQIKFNSENQAGKILKNCLTQIDFLKEELNKLKSKNPSVQSVVSSESPLHELWNNEVDDVWNKF